MNELPSRPRLGDEERAVQIAMRRFGDRITGTWWERIQAKGEPPALSFLTIEFDEVHSSVRLEGKAYSAAGVRVANWRSVAARLEGEKVVYVSECERRDAKTTAWLPGLAEVTFHGSGDVIDQGDGKFWESDESHLEETVIKFVELRRSRDESEAFTMLKGSEGGRQALIEVRLGIW
jgi:hypothetical protein